MTKTEIWNANHGTKPIGAKCCQVCGETFSIFKPRDHTRAKYCSQKCAGVANGTKQKEAFAARNRVPREERKCLHCNEPFSVRPNMKLEGKRKYCSRKCASIHCRSGKEKAPTKQFVCTICGTEFTDYASRSRTTCSKRCQRLSGPFQDTSIEKKIWELIKDIDGAVKQHVLGPIYTTDFALLGHKILIECDGEYWHSKPHAIRRDSIKDKLAKEMGWLMIRLPEKQINEDIESCDRQIKEVIALRSQKCHGEEPPSAESK